MKVGIVGAEAAKFTPETEARARERIRWLIQQAELVISGHCHLGGIDLWAIEEARALGIPVQEYPPATLRWHDGYKPRNLQIALASDAVACITLKVLPENYHGLRFGFCYHCGTDEHVKSGGCWTMKQAAALGKRTRLVIVDSGPGAL